MSARTLGNLGLSAFWALGENAWKDLNDANLVRLSNLVQGHAKSRVTSLPGSPTNGDVYVLTDAAGSHPTEIAIRDNGAWVYTVPQEGWRMWIDDENAYYTFSGTAWTLFAGPARRNFVMQLSGTALASSEILMAITPNGDETLTFAGNMANSTGKKMTGGTNPGSTFTGNINKNNSTVGTWVISTSGVVSFTTTGSAAISLAPGDILEFVGPSTVSTALGFMFTIAATATF